MALTLYNAVTHLGSLWAASCLGRGYICGSRDLLSPNRLGRDRKEAEQTLQYLLCIMRYHKSTTCISRYRKIWIICGTSFTRHRAAYLFCYISACMFTRKQHLQSQIGWFADCDMKCRVTVVADCRLQRSSNLTAPVLAGAAC